MMEGTETNWETLIRRFMGAPFWVMLEVEFRRLLRSRKFKVLFLVTFFPDLIYLLSPNASGSGIDAMLKSFQYLMLDLLPNYWLGIIGQLIAIILMSDLLASEIDRGTVRLLISKPVKFGEIIAAKFLAGVGALAVLFGLPYTVIWLYNPIVYGTGFKGLEEGFTAFLLVLGATLLVLALLGALTMFISVVISRPLYTALSSFGLVFLLQYLLPQIPYIKNPGHYTLGYQTVVILKAGFDRVDLSTFSGDPARSSLFLMTALVVFLLLTWGWLRKREFPD